MFAFFILAIWLISSTLDKFNRGQKISALLSVFLGIIVIGFYLLKITNNLSYINLPVLAFASLIGLASIALDSYNQGGKLNYFLYATFVAIMIVQFIFFILLFLGYL